MELRKAEREQTAFLLSQVGAHAASLFGQRLLALELTPPDAGILRLLRMAAGISQQELAARLQIHPSRLVAVLDNLETRKLVERKPNSEDRRLYSLHLTREGHEILAKIGQISLQHQQALCSALTEEERDKLAELLQKIADAQGLSPGIHPGYQRLREARPRQTKPSRSPGRR